MFQDYIKTTLGCLSIKHVTDDFIFFLYELIMINEEALLSVVNFSTHVLLGKCLETD